MDAQEIRNLQEAYMEVVENQQLDEISIGDRARNAVADDRLDAEQERTNTSMNRLRQQNNRFARVDASNAARKVERDVRKSNSYGPQRPKPGTVTARRIEGPKPTGSKPTGYRIEETDIYDIILSHLLDEGYADTQESAEAIMVNMSEEWRDSIVEEFEELGEGKVELDQKRRTRMGNQIGNKIRSADAEHSLSNDTMYPKGLRGAMKKGARKKVEQAQRIMGALKSAQKSNG